MRNQNPSPNPQPGDLIEIFKGMYSHWAIYIGDGEVIHLTSDGASADVSVRFSSSAKTAVVKREPFDTVVGSNDWHINNSDGKRKPLPSDDIIKKAKAMVGQKVCYNVIKQNCEHFVNSLRYGESVSDQATAVTSVASIFACAIAIVAAVLLRRPLS
ncbi:phospholipase A and acyltransferase 3-like [Pristis pectinata]|uniref:phospholipase A and acyltransferase 3-like n=1 Tax=Pristis pectinata TaxID=685728 RepID=UPI00223CC2D3|nr:phospholipase A and acyltransferase 3-like [Pristis pectinata]